MIKFFRNIRKRMLGENRFTRYLLYAVGEIILVVIGILLALQINNWNEGRKELKAEVEFLKGVKTDLKQDRDFIVYVMDINQDKLKTYAILEEWAEKGNSQNKRVGDSLFLRYISQGQRTFYPVSGAFQSAVSGNQLNNFKDKETTSALVKLYNSTYARLLDNAQILDGRWGEVSKAYIHERRTHKLKDPSNEYLIGAIDDITYHLIQLEWYLNTLEKALIEIDTILESEAINSL